MPDWLFQALGVIAAGVGVYSAIRVDLAVTRSKAEAACDRADSAHSRLDSFLEHAPCRYTGPHS